MVEDVKQGIKNILSGLVWAAFYFVTLILIPSYTFEALQSYTVSGVTIAIPTQQYEKLTFWIGNLGMVIVGLGFFAHSSPKRSIRKAVLGLLKIFVNALYIWVYKFSGVTVLTFDFSDPGVYGAVVSVDFSTIVMMLMGVFFLNIILAIYDLLDFAIFPDPETKSAKKDVLNTLNKQKKQKTKKGGDSEGSSKKRRCKECEICG